MQLQKKHYLPIFVSAAAAGIAYLLWQNYKQE